MKLYSRDCLSGESAKPPKAQTLSQDFRPFVVVVSDWDCKNWLYFKSENGMM